MSYTNLNYYIDHTLLDQTADETSIRKICDEAREFRFHAVCVNPNWTALAAGELSGSGVVVCSVASFPLGASKADIKLAEAARAVEDGALEIDMVANIGWILSGQWTQVESEIRLVRRELPVSVLLKVIIEVGRLDDDQIIRACRVVGNAGAEYVKSGTGFFGPVTTAQVQTMVRATEGRLKVKAAGGIRTREAALAMLEAGASRLGCSVSCTIAESAK